MLIEWFTDFVFSVLKAIFELIPWPADLGLDSAAAAFSLMGVFNTIFPVTELLAVGAAILGLQAVLLLYRLIKIGLSHVPLIGGAG